jgi:hypothetical protein
MVRAPQDSPGVKLQLVRGKISPWVKYFLLTAMVPEVWDTLLLFLNVIRMLILSNYIDKTH